MSNSKNPIRIIGVPMDLGQARRGVDMGPSALRYAGLDDRLRALDYQIDDYGNIDVPIRDTLPPEGGIQFMDAVVKICEAVYQAGQTAINDGCLPIFLGGDHSIALGTVGGVSHTEPVSVLWIDAHGDFNTPEISPSGNLHGMPLAALTGHGAPEMVNLGRHGAKIAPDQVALIGVRDIDLQEGELLKNSGCIIYTMSHIDTRGIAEVAQEALSRLKHPRIHVSFDVDSLSPAEAPGVGTPVRGGLTYREAHLLMEIIADSNRVASLDVVEINPILDTRNQTAELAIDLVASLLGQRIL